MAKKKPLSKRAKARQAKMRRDPFGRLCQEVNRYLETVGWRAVVMGKPQVRGFESPGLGRYEFTLEFSGGRIKQPESADAVDPQADSTGTPPTREK
jgi:hypothetical protein